MQWGTRLWGAAAAALLSFGAHADVRFLLDSATAQFDDGSITLDVLRTGVGTGDVTVTYRTRSETAVDGVHFTGQSGSLQWIGPDHATQQITIPLLDNSDILSDKYFVLELMDSLQTESIVEPNRVVVNIRADDQITNAGRFRLSPYPVVTQVGGQEFVDVQVLRERGSAGPAEIRVRTLDDGNGVLFYDVDDVLRWPDGDLSHRTVRVEVLPQAGRDEPFTLRMQAFDPSPGASIYEDGIVRFPMPDRDGLLEASVSFTNDQPVVYPRAERIFALVSRSAASNLNNEVVVNWRVTAGTAQPDVDYDASQAFGQIVWAAGETDTRIIEIPIIGDRREDRTLQIGLFSPTNSGGVDPGAPVDEQFLRHQDWLIQARDDTFVPGVAGEVSFRQAQQVIPNGLGQVTAIVSRTGFAPLAELTVDYQILDGNTVAGVDYDAAGASGTLTWAADEVGARPLTIDLLHPVTTVDRTFEIVLTTPATGAVQRQFITVLPPEAYQVGTVEFEAGARNFPGTVSTVQVLVDREGINNRPASVRYRLEDMNTIAGEDYPLASASGVMDWAAGENGFRSIAIPILQTSDVARSFRLILESEDANVLGANDETTVTVAAFVPHPVDPVELGQASFLDAQTQVVNSASQVIIPVQRDGALPLDENTVSYRIAADTARPGIDYPSDAITGELTWSIDDTGLRTIVIPILAAQRDVARRFTVELLGAGVDAANSLHEVILDPSAVGDPGTIGFLDTQDVNVPNFLTRIVLPVQRSAVGGNPVGAVNISWSIRGGDAVAGVDFESASAFGTLSWASDEEGFKTITVELLTDRPQLVNRSFQLVLEGGGVDPLLKQRAVILEADPLMVPEEGTVGLSDTFELLVPAGATRVILPVERTAAPGQALTALDTAWRVMGGTALPDADYDASLAFGTLNWAANERGFRSIEIPLLPNRSDQAERTIVVEISGHGVVAARDTRTARLLVDQSNVERVGSIYFPDSTPLYIDHSAQQIVVPVVREVASGIPVAVDVRYRIINSTAIAEEDFPSEAAFGTLSWAENEEGFQSITIPLLAGRTQDQERQFTIVVEGAGVSGAAAVRQVVLLADPNQDQSRIGVIGFPDIGDVYISHAASSVVLSVIRDIDGYAQPANVQWRIVDGNATAGADYLPGADFGALTWAENEIGFKSIEIPLLSTRDASSERYFTIELTGRGVVNEASLRTVRLSPDPEQVPDPGTISFDRSQLTAAPGAQEVLVRLLRGGEKGSGVVTVEILNAGRPTGLIASWDDGDLEPVLVSIPLVDLDAGESGELQYQLRVTEGGAVLTQPNTLTILVQGPLVDEGGSGSLGWGLLALLACAGLGRKRKVHHG